MSKHHFLSKELRSAFFNPQIPGTIFLEARFLNQENVSSLSYVLRTLSSVTARSLTVVSPTEVRPCLSVRGSFTPALRCPGEWVKIKRGLYSGDVGVVVHAFDTWAGIKGCKVGLVPRLESLHRKRQRSSTEPRPPPSLFDPENCVQDSTSEIGFQFDRFTFEGGLIIKTYHDISMEPAKAIPSELIAFFLISTHPVIRRATMPIPTHWHFDVGDSVWVPRPNISALMKGTILETNIDTMNRPMFVVETEEGSQLYSPLHLSKDVKPGDYVEILVGDEAGKTGFVIARNQDILTIAPDRFGVDSVGNVFLTLFGLLTLTTRNSGLTSIASKR